MNANPNSPGQPSENAFLDFECSDVVITTALPCPRTECSGVLGAKKRTSTTADLEVIGM